MSKGKNSHLTAYICVALVLAIVSALALPQLSMNFRVGGEIFLRLLKMLVVPLVMASVMSGILGMGDIRKLGRPGGTAVVYYLTTTLLAVFVGLAVVNIIKPGSNFDTAEMHGPAATAENDVRKHLAEVTDRSEGEIADVFEDLPSPAEDANVSTILENLVLMLVSDNLVLSAAEEIGRAHV